MAENKVCPHCNVSFVEEDWPDGAPCPVCGKGGFEEKSSAMDAVFLGVSRVFSSLVNILFLAIKAGIIALICYALFLLYRYAIADKKPREEAKPASQSLLLPRRLAPSEAVSALLASVRPGGIGDSSRS